MNKIPCTSQNTKTKTLPVSLVTLDGFHLLLSTQLTADLTSEWSGGSMFHPLSYIYTNTTFYHVETVANNSLNRRCVVIFDWLWANATPTLNTAFSLTNVHAKWWIHCFLISSTLLLSYATSIYDWPKRGWWSFWVFSRSTAKFGWPECSASFVSVQPHLKPPLHHCFRWSWVRITLIKPLLCLNSIFFPIRKQCFINTRNSDFSIVLKICNSNFT